MGILLFLMVNGGSNRLARPDRFARAVREWYRRTLPGYPLWRLLGKLTPACGVHASLRATFAERPRRPRSVSKPFWPPQKTLPCDPLKYQEPLLRLKKSIDCCRYWDEVGGLKPPTLSLNGQPSPVPSSRPGICWSVHPGQSSVSYPLSRLIR
jgi:hypothetical protein